MVSGWIILDKESGMFSRAAGQKVANIFGSKKFGHIGTLDPMATGVLPIAVGGATKMIPFIEQVNSGIKEYEFSMQFGFETDTLDITGKVINKKDYIPSETDVRFNLNRFVGKIEQIPPMYSAVHVNGNRAYILARKNVDFEIKARQIEIYGLQLIKIINKSFYFKVKCSTGTYVRSLARDIAYFFCTFATVDSIRRVFTNGFDIKNAVTLDFLEKQVHNNADIGVFLQPVDLGLGGIPVLNLDSESIVLYKNGGFIVCCGVADGLYRIYAGGVFIGIGSVTDEVLHPKRTI